jgi:cell division protein FtsI (penicillin-binding protein 3)
MVQRLLGGGLALAFCAVAARTAQYAITSQAELPMMAAASAAPSFGKPRPDILDRNGRLLATDIRVYWLYANPEQILAPDDAAEKLAGLFHDLDQGALAARLRDKSSRFEWVKRGLTPAQANAVHRLGMPGLTLVPSLGRVYPSGNEAGQILGVVNVDNVGLSGIEKYASDRQDAFPASSTQRPVVRLSIDLGVQHVLSDELRAAIAKYQAKAAFGTILDVETGEVLACASLPDFDPNRREQAASEDFRNRTLADIYELGSVFKAVTVAMALENGVVAADGTVDARPIRVGRFLLQDKHAKTAMMTVEEVFAHSSNTGAARLALLTGVANQRLFLKKLGLMDRIETEAGISPTPVTPKTWRPSNAITVSYGHGISVPPLLFTAAAAALVNGGKAVRPTFLLNTSGEDDRGEQVIKPETSAAMRELMRQTVARGTGRRAAVKGIPVGGKTGTAWKVKDGTYSRDVMNSFVAAFPIDKPKYVLMVTLDEPQAEKPGASNEASQNAAPVAGAIIARASSLLNVLPTARFDEPKAAPYDNTPAAASPAKGRTKEARNEASGVDRGYPRSSPVWSAARNRDQGRDIRQPDREAWYDFRGAPWHDR